MKQYVFILGRTVPLCFAELSAVLSSFYPDCEIRFQKDQVVLVESREEIDINGLMSRLGGTVKIGEVVDGGLQKDQLVLSLVDFLLQDSESHTHERVGEVISIDPAKPEQNGAKTMGLKPMEVLQREKHDKIYFAISSYGATISTFDVCVEIKSRLRGDRKVRFFHSSTNELSASQIVLSGIKREGVEFLLFPTDGKISVARTLAVYDFEGFSFRDAKRPRPNPKKGMLPPRVARMMINLAIGSKNLKGLRFLDPFCGVGTIINEALILGMWSNGVDSSKNAVFAARENLKWLLEKYPKVYVNSSEHKVEETILLGDATHVSSFFPSLAFDCIVTEPFMGRLFNEDPSSKQIEPIIVGLEKLYKGFLKEAWKVLKEDGRIVMIFPTFRVKNEKGEPIVKNLKIIDSLNILGYNVVQGPLEYSRPNAIVSRKIYVLVKRSL